MVYIKKIYLLRGGYKRHDVMAGDFGSSLSVSEDAADKSASSCLSDSDTANTNLFSWHNAQNFASPCRGSKAYAEWLQA